MKTLYSRWNEILPIVQSSFILIVPDKSVKYAMNMPS